MIFCCFCDRKGISQCLQTYVYKDRLYVFHTKLKSLEEWVTVTENNKYVISFNSKVIGAKLLLYIYADESVYRLNEAKVCRFYAELLLRTANKVLCTLLLRISYFYISPQFHIYCSKFLWSFFL